MQFITERLADAGTISVLVYVMVLLAGVVSALSPCFLPVLTMFGGYVTGYTQETGREPLRMAAAFTGGQAVTLAAVGIAVVLLGKSVLGLFTGYELDRYIPAIIGIVMGLQLLGLLKFNLPTIRRFKAKRPESIWGSFTLGLPFGLVVTPCTIPIFITLITYLALKATLLHGALLMASYALGRGLVLGAVAFSAGTISELKGGKLTIPLKRISGVVILLASLYLLFFYQYSRMAMPTM
jgi:cytochrome c-type biogenesis protein